MRGSDLNKAIHKSNYFIKKSLLLSTILFNTLIIILLYFNNRFDKFKFFISSCPEIFTILCIFKISAPVIRKNGNIEELVDPGTALSGKGIASVLFDSLVICMLVKMFIFYSYYWCILYVFIALSAFYEMVYKTVKKLKTQ
ncbi:n-acetylglucosaminylphosphatidylinositol de-n-acetylase family protein [Vairimorpha ceranae]|uniref:N-acetylglucosaminylphosphatidylinositol de-n-acetylase family protein n=1 Tax=Vairimorpha ceranae TaxID=40302 RepID=A0A0F9YVB1_9MICR|nr:n-acetylglucosaminylphosphatidylinositol de-n-acetylase family protein [Vairimorpha ceranae]KAF5141379.1 hypothetical protein G9O61_00g006960 [Vairimorpha ceranae]KKO76347.1 n-acetylglucosaminylphosphatidylinositol de-n-acetylase family protein [Vairimorpha ceranae]